MPRLSDRCCFSLIIGLVCGVASAASVHAASPRALPAGQVPKDVRLGAPKDLNGYFPLVVPKTKAEWEERAAKVRRQILVSQGIWPLPTKRSPWNFPCCSALAWPIRNSVAR